MALKLSKESPVKGLLITTNQDDKFRTETVVVRFITPREKIKTQRYYAVSELLSESCARYPEKKLMTRALMNLYGASLGRFTYPAGAYAVTGLTISSIADRYTFGAENISAPLAQMLLDCIFEPDIRDGKFNETYYSNTMHDLITRIRKQKNDRHSYAIDRANQIAFAGEPMELSITGTLEEAETITNESLVESYRELLKNSFISISFCGGGTNTEAQKLIMDRFVEFASHRGYTGGDLDNLMAVSEIKPEPEYVTEPEEQSQSKLVMIYKFNCGDEFAVKLAVLLFGGTPFSKLFMNVREKMSLCYYCQASSSAEKNSVLVDSGVGRGDEQKAIDEIKNQLEQLKNGGFTDAELENTKRYYIGAIRSAYDFSADLNTWFFRRFERGDMLTPAEAEKLIEAVDRERVLAALKELRLDTVYVYEASGSSADGTSDDNDESEDADE